MAKLESLALAALALLAAPAQAQSPEAWCPAPRALREVGRDDFQDGLAQWRLEAQDARAEVRVEVSTTGGVLDIQTPAGLSLWWRQPIAGDYAVRFTAEALPAPATAGPQLAGRLSDLNMFWNATEPDGAAPRHRSGAFASYDSLRAYYVGFGANGNRSTRLRWYDGSGARHLLNGWADAAEATPQDRQGPMTDAVRLRPGQPRVIQLVSRAPTAADPVHLRWWADGRLLFEQALPAPMLGGYFALRTTASRLQIRSFRVLACELTEPPASSAPVRP
jgi:Domain of unknown function (DUF6250)